MSHPQRGDRLRIRIWVLGARRCVSPVEAVCKRLVFHCRTTSASTAPFASRRMCCPTHCASDCAPCQPLLREFSGWNRSPPPTAVCKAQLPVRAVRSGCSTPRWGTSENFRHKSYSKSFTWIRKSEQQTGPGTEDLLHFNGSRTLIHKHETKCCVLKFAPVTWRSLLFLMKL